METIIWNLQQPGALIWDRTAKTRFRMVRHDASDDSPLSRKMPNVDYVCPNIPTAFTSRLRSWHFLAFSGWTGRAVLGFACVVWSLPFIGGIVKIMVPFWVP